MPDGWPGVFLDLTGDLFNCTTGRPKHTISAEHVKAVMEEVGLIVCCPAQPVAADPRRSIIPPQHTIASMTTFAAAIKWKPSSQHTGKTHAGPILLLSTQCLHVSVTTWSLLCFCGYGFLLFGWAIGFETRKLGPLPPSHLLDTRVTVAS